MVISQVAHNNEAIFRLQSLDIAFGSKFQFLILLFTWPKLVQLCSHTHILISRDWGEEVCVNKIYLFYVLINQLQSTYDLVLQFYLFLQYYQLFGYQCFTNLNCCFSEDFVAQNSHLNDCYFTDNILLDVEDTLTLLSIHIRPFILLQHNFLVLIAYCHFEVNLLLWSLFIYLKLNLLNPNKWHAVFRVVNCFQLFVLSLNYPAFELSMNECLG